MTPSRLLLWHGLGLAWFAYIARLTANIEALGAQAAATAGIDTYGGVWKFLTFLNLVLQAVLCGISFLVDVFTLMEKQRIAKFVVPFRDLLFGSLAFPVSMFVTSSFWILYLYDRKLVYPESLDAYIPVWMNHAMPRFAHHSLSITALNHGSSTGLGCKNISSSVRTSTKRNRVETLYEHCASHHVFVLPPVKLRGPFCTTPNEMF
uniref:Uncharacterized protein n=1 Tax=Sphaerodactylus townsendi TaxID=933632 RepID=A0ACB8FC54_9SAUR